MMGYYTRTFRKLPSWLLLWSVVSTSGYAAFAGLAFSIQNVLVYRPYQDMLSPADSGVPEMQEVYVLSEDGLPLKSWYAPPHDQQKAVILYCHGNVGNVATRTSRVKPFLAHGYGVMLVGYRGYGGNPGTPSENGLLDDAQASFTYLMKQGIRQQQVILYGESLGTSVTVSLAVRHHVCAVVLENPFPSIVDVARLSYWYLPVQYLVKDRFESIQRIHLVRSPILILHSEKDISVPIELGRKLFLAATSSTIKEFSSLPEKTHTDSFVHSISLKTIEFADRLDKKQSMLDISD